ncbi:Protein of unknown function DUF2235 [Burkholderia sp. lig30]|jgi:hypothetical protein|nr:Protein of unknown function DUF2235 [Burkholderia sp. lig30]
MALFDALRTLSVSGAALPMHGDHPILTPLKLAGGETIGELFEYTLELKAPDALGFSQCVAANVDLDKLIGTEVTVSIQLEGKGHFIPGLAGDAGMANIGADTREITGVVTDAAIVWEKARSIVYPLCIRHEVAYPDAHSDVGGGYAPNEQGKGRDPDQGDGGKLSQIALHDMYLHALKYGVPMMKGDEILSRADFKVEYIAQGMIDEERNRLYRKGGMQ